LAYQDMNASQPDFGHPENFVLSPSQNFLYKKRASCASKRPRI